MSFFDLPQRDLEEERRKFLEGDIKDGDEDVPVFNWGEESYDGLGDALQEGGDELNDETFGNVGDVGKDFDFSQPAIPGYEPPPRPKQEPTKDEVPPAPESREQQQPQQQHQQQQQQPQSQGVPTLTSRPSVQSLESIWDDKSLASILPKANGSSVLRNQDQQHLHHHQPSRSIATPPVPQASARFSPFTAGDVPVPQHDPIGQGIGHVQHQQQQQRVRTLQEIEEEMLFQAARARQKQQEQEMLERAILQQRIDEQRLHEQELRRQELLHFQQEQQKEQLQRLVQLQQQQQQQIHQHQQRGSQGTPPPPRMLPVSQSPRFLEHHRQQALLLQQQQQQERLHQQQQLLLQQERERERQRQLMLLEEQRRMEELEKRLAHNLMLENKPGSPWRGHQEAPQFPNEHLAHRQFATPSPARHLLQQQQQHGQFGPGVVVGLQEGIPLSQQQSLQLQQRLLAEMSQQEYARDVHGMGPNQEQLRLEAMRKILEAEKMEEKRRRKAQKLAYMARYNDLMTQSDKDFITRIQVSQLVTQDPYADDFYAQVYGAILRSRMGLQAHDERVLKFGSGGGVGLGLAPKGGNRRPSAMQRMEQQVERIVNNARKREEEKGLHSLHSLQGALGKTSGRSYKAAPRQLLQVESASPNLSPAHAHISKASVYNEGAAQEAAKLGREALGDAAHDGEVVRQEPLTRRETLVILERLYDLVLHVEQLRRDQPHPEDPPEAMEQWKKEYDENVELIWKEMRVNVPLETSNPHPFISLLMPTKGKKVLPRLTRHLPSDKMLILLTLLVACFDQLDVIKSAPVLDSLVETSERSEVERQTQAFLGSVMQAILPIVSVAELRLVTGLLSLLLHRTNVVAVAQTRPGLALLTLFLSRVEVIKQTINSGAEQTEMPTAEESQAWQMMFDHLFQLLAPHLMLLFPSTRIAHTNITGQPPANPTSIDIVDQPVWQFLAALALHAVTEQHQILVTALREKVLDNVLSVNKGWVADEEERQTKLANVNLFLHALGLDSSQIAL
ncbi:topoisomerase II [Coprinopsis cinerea AmutBmut pab1-1]|nr:topoisomerase II [Coprinopsis cinerea AmutBmut pab1-1]